jgi:hypothetical protein
MLSNNQTSDQKYEVKLEFSCWISEFHLHISPTSNKVFLYLILIMMWQMFVLGLCFFVLLVMNIQTLEISKENINLSFSSRNLSSVSQYNLTHYPVLYTSCTSTAKLLTVFYTLILSDLIPSLNAYLNCENFSSLPLYFITLCTAWAR